MTVIQAPSPSVAGMFTACPLGFLLHGSRSGLDRSELAEFEGTVRYAQGGAGGLGWHVTVMSGKVAIHMRPYAYGWNAYEASKLYIACEFSQPRLGDPIPDAAIDAFCWYIVEHVLPVWPAIPLNLVHHASLPEGKRDGKTDAFPDGDPRQAEMNERVLARLALA